MKFVLSFFLAIFLLCQPCFAAEKEIILDLYQQRGLAEENGQVVHEFDLMSGHEVKAPTPEGYFRIRRKVKDYYSRSYNAEMPYAMFFYGSYALHAWSWDEPLPQREERRYYASHGCVSANLADAKWLFEWADIGTPIYIFGERLHD